MKRTICMILSIMMLCLLAGCQAEPPVNTAPSADSTPVQTQSLTTVSETPAETTTPQTSATVLSAEKDAELRADLQARIDEILNTETEIVHSDTYIPGETYTGTAYYVSNDGDDNNDGLTPETAWQTPFKIVYELTQEDGNRTIQPGDAVFFRRGDIFRFTDFDLHISTDGITFSAYGEGEKPIITGSSENGTGTEKWKLIYEDASGKKIWQYYRDMRDVCSIILNNGEVIATRILEYYDENGYISCEDTYWWMHEDKGVTLLDALLPLEESMTENFTIISRPVRVKETPDHQNYSAPAYGPLYLRCDQGNPGMLYDSIEFTEYNGAPLVYINASDIVFDNLSFRSCGLFYVMSEGPWWEFENRIFQNCEFAYGGGTVNQYYDNGPDSKIVVSIGDGIYSVVKNTTIRNNYFHNSITTATTYEWDTNETQTSGGYYHVLDNVIVNTMGLRLDSTSDSLQHLDSVVVRGNQIWNTGHWDNGKYFYSEGSIFLSPNHYGECIIEDNVLYGTENGYESNGLLNIWFYENQDNTIPQIRSNIYVQHADRKFGYFSMWEERDWYMNDQELIAKAAELLGDTTSEFYIIE